MNKVFFLLVSIIAIDAYSHEFNPAHLVINQSYQDQNTYQASWMYPVKNIGKRAEIILPSFCTTVSKEPFIKNKYIVEQITINCSQAINGSSIQIKDLSVLTDALVTINFIDSTFEGIVNVQNPEVEIPMENQYYPTAYLYLGFDHLLDGLDHILFILGLLFCISGFVNIIKTITAFTIAHSLTLGLSVLDIISLPQATVEALIALTIIYLATEISKNRKIINTPWFMAFGFGLLHGLGFAGALNEIGIANSQMLLSLLFFNIGIELGQIALIPIPLSLIFLSKQFNYINQVKVIMSLAVGGMGFYWFIDRVIGIIL
ncbi:HupE/UreJ family protein [Gammaproteobacteria bacterium]|nr:HupE/UreJ family protein [Gammaproteobacteria bacterium]MDA8957800.1 HupE/UreJ family protein [Gammaproteobacteria bacterium]MDA9038977.1 HupE/UreJ family protein [Gammaproteobacteria bacterium]